MNLTTLARLKNFMPGSPPSEADDALNQIIAGVSGQIAHYLGVKFLVKEVTEYQKINNSRTERIFCDRPDIHSISSMYNDADREFTAGDLLDPDDYDFEPKFFFIPDLLLEPGYKALKVTYVGGYAFGPDYYVSRINDGATVTPSTGDIYLVGSAPTGDFSAATANQLATWNGASWDFSDQVTGLYTEKPEIELACQMQAAFIYQKRPRTGSKYSAIKSSQTTLVEEPLLQEVRGMLHGHRHIRI